MGAIVDSDEQEAQLIVLTGNQFDSKLAARGRD